MTIYMLEDAEILRARLRDLTALQQRVNDEILLTQQRLERKVDAARVRRPRGIRPPCGTAEGYQWHRYHDPDHWPLPADDPCGCRAAHNQQQRLRDAARRVHGGAA